MSESTQRLFLGLTMSVVGAASIGSVYQVAARSIACGDLPCQLRYAASYNFISNLPLGMFVLIGAVVLLLIFISFQLSPERLRTLCCFSALAICIGALLLTLRIAAIETILLHGWSWSCVAAGWLSSVLLCAGIFLAARGYPRTRFQGGSFALGAILVAGLSWHLMQAGGIGRVQEQNVNWRLLSSGRGYSLGPASARVQIVEFADFQCPPCQRLAPNLRKLAAKYDGKFRLVQRELPNPRTHPQAERAAEIAECFGEQGKFWEAAAELYQSSIPDDTRLETWTTRLGAAKPQFMACMAQHRGHAAIVQDRQDARALGVSHTPTLFIGRMMVEGATPLDKLEGLLRYEMAEHPPTVQSASDPLAPANGGCAVQSDADNTASQKKEKDQGCR